MRELLARWGRVWIVVTPFLLVGGWRWLSGKAVPWWAWIAMGGAALLGLMAWRESGVTYPH